MLAIASLLLLIRCGGLEEADPVSRDVAAITANGNDAAFVSQSVPTSMAAAATASVTVTMRNTGTSTWTTAGWKLGSQNPQDNLTWGMNRVNLPASVAPGATATFTFTITAPTTLGTYNFQWRMVNEYVEWFGTTTTNVAVAVVQATDNATFVSQSVPTSMAPAATATVTVTMRNTGNGPWTDALQYRLGSQNPQDNTTWRASNRVSLAAGESIAVGAQKAFSFTITAPTTPGTYNFQWRMVRDSVGWFGAYSTNVAIPVTATTYSISGAAGAAGVTVTAGSRSATSDVNGNYTVTGLSAGTYAVTPSKSGCTFTPTSRSVTVGPNATGKNFTASCSTTYSISGAAGAAGVTVTAGSRSATSDVSGNYTITGLSAGTYAVTPSKSGCTFTPTSRSVTVGPNATGKNFTPTCANVCVASLAACVNSTTQGVCNATGTAWLSQTACGSGNVCENGGCIATAVWHLARSGDFQLVQSYAASQLDGCNVSAAVDRQSGLLLCDAWHSVQTLQPRFGLFLGNSWVTMGAGSGDTCLDQAPAAARACLATRLAATVERFHRVAPSFVAEAHLAEFVHRNNVTTAWPDSICLAGSVGQWGTDTCIPDVTGKQAARDYLVDWGKAFIDGGIRAFQFGQARILAGDGGNNAVSYAGAAALADIMTRIRTYAQGRGATRVFFGVQAASSVKTSAGGAELADFVMGAQHLEIVDGLLLQPLTTNGGFLNPLPEYGGTADWHDANLVNDANGLPVVLDYDNWSRTPPDDIHNLRALATNADRSRAFEDHFRHLRTYNPQATLSVPIAKSLVAGCVATCSTSTDYTNGNCPGINQWHFSADANGLTGAVSEVWAWADSGTLPTGALGATDPPIRRDLWGQQLRGRDAIVAWFYWALLGRRVGAAEYPGALANLPAIVDTGAGARLTYATALVSGAEFFARGLSNTDYVTAVYRAILLRDPDADGLTFYVGQLGSGGQTRLQVLGNLCYSSEAAALYAP